MENRVKILWKDFNIKLKGFILVRVKNEDVANDILQEVFLKVHLNISKLKDTTKLTSWVYQITRNSITDYYRKSKPTEEVNEELSNDTEFEHNYNEIFQNDIRCYIDELPEMYKEALILTQYKGMSQIQLADHLGISYSGAKTRVQRAKEKLREMFTDCCEIESDSFGNIVNYYKKPRCCGSSPCK